MLTERDVRTAYSRVAGSGNPGRTLRHLFFFLLACGPHAPEPDAIDVPARHRLEDVAAAVHPGEALEAALGLIAHTEKAQWHTERALDLDLCDRSPARKSAAASATAPRAHDPTRLCGSALGQRLRAEAAARLA